LPVSDHLKAATNDHFKCRHFEACSVHRLPWLQLPAAGEYAMNRLKMAMNETILSLHQRGWSNRRIAKELGIDRDTVSRHVRQFQAEANAAKMIIGSAAGPGEANAATVIIGAEKAPTAQPDPGEAAGAAGRRPSLCEPLRAVILGKVELGLSAQRIYQDLVSEHGFVGHYHTVRRFVRSLGPSNPLPFRRLECAPGEEAQVDFGRGIPITGADGKRRHTHVFRILLSHSRKGYSEAVYRQTTEAFLRCLENAFRHFGGVPKTLVLDNLKAGVETPDWYDPELNPKLRSFADHYRIAILPTRPRTPRHKGKIESGIGYVKKNALKGRVFTSLEEENRCLRHWEATVADTRLHGTTRQQVGKVFREVERPALQSLPLEPFPCFQEGERSVNRDGHVEVARAYYSAPPEYRGRRIWVRWDSRTVRLFNQRFEPIALHVRQEPGRFSTLTEHIASQKISSLERGGGWMLARVRTVIGAHSAGWAEAVLQTRGIEGLRVVQGLLSLANKHTAAELEKACEIAHSYASYRLRTIRTLLKRSADQRPKQESFLETHPLIRDLTDYAQIVHAAVQKGIAQ
jgi:transposase